MVFLFPQLQIIASLMAWLIVHIYEEVNYLKMLIT